MSEEIEDGVNFGSTLGSLVRDLIRRQFYDFIRAKGTKLPSRELVKEWEIFQNTFDEARMRGVFLEILYYFQRSKRLKRLEREGTLFSEIFPVTETPRGSYDFVEFRTKGVSPINRVIQVKSARPADMSSMRQKAQFVRGNFGMQFALATPKSRKNLPLKFDDWNVTNIKPDGDD
ncbi:MAG: hypothetical protein JRM77_08500 [Nitrososphaerota archaeon]|jgi:hypothetical protein|nr:hypothetical protein [Nitrososphaerota archaeon]